MKRRRTDFHMPHQSRTVVQIIHINKQNAADTILTNIEQVLGVGDIQNSESSSSKVDVTIVLGKDYV